MSTPTPAPNPAPVVCPCGNPLPERKMSAARRANRKYCSRVCSGRYGGGKALRPEGQACPRCGNPLAPPNLYTNKRGYTRCRECCIRASRAQGDGRRAARAAQLAAQPEQQAQQAPPKPPKRSKPRPATRRPAVAVVELAPLFTPPPAAPGAAPWRPVGFSARPVA